MDKATVMEECYSHIMYKEEINTYRCTNSENNFMNINNNNNN